MSPSSPSRENIPQNEIRRLADQFIMNRDYNEPHFYRRDLLFNSDAEKDEQIKYEFEDGDERKIDNIYPKIVIEASYKPRNESYEKKNFSKNQLKYEKLMNIR